jgi:anti-sigma B factor antagonist
MSSRHRTARKPLEASPSRARSTRPSGGRRQEGALTVTGSPANGFGAALGPPAFSIDDELSPGRTAVFSVHGELDLHEAPELQDRISAAIDRGARLIVVDLTDVTFIDSMALGVLLGASNRLGPTGGSLRLVVPSPGIRRIFEISLLDHVLTLDSTRGAALAAGAGPS